MQKLGKHNLAVQLNDQVQNTYSKKFIPAFKDTFDRILQILRKNVI